MNQSGQTICLNMIVKNEAHVIERCLASVRPWIDCWVIVDTGSTDGTQELIRKALNDIPGEVVERLWVNFSVNRTEALHLAGTRADYVLIIDADEVLEADEGFSMPALTEDSYQLQSFYSGCEYARNQLIRAALPWRYEGVVHEYLTCEQAETSALLAGLRILVFHEGARSLDPLTYYRDALLLEQALRTDPENKRNVFYLAQSYRDAGEIKSALQHYRRRASMGGWADEVWFSLYQIARLTETSGTEPAAAPGQYLAAFQYQPERAEPLYHLGMHYQRKREFNNAHLFFSRAMEISRPEPARLFIDRAIYDYLLPMEYAVTCFYVGQHAEAIRVNTQLLGSSALPAHLRDQVERNRQFSLDVASSNG